MKNIILIFSGLILWALCYGQEFQIKSSEGGGEVLFERSNPCLSDEKRSFIIHKLQNKRRSLRSKGLLNPPGKSMIVSFIWPIKQAPGFNYNSTYRITNYVDHNSDYPDELLDYNCGDRSYDTDGGYNHRGVDIALYPFQWHQVMNNQTQVIAAAAGTIIGKDDGNFDANCEFNDGDWNAVYIEHADGSIAWYGHMKNGSLTSKGEGDNVSEGEYLGIVASSGNSTGPHLHFEVYDSGGNLIDPFAGPCNSLNNSSWWANQKPYREPTINAIFTHTAEPEYPDCPGLATTNLSNSFDFGDEVFFTIFLHDQLINTSAEFVIYRPDNSIFDSWTRNFNNTFTSAYWWSSRTIPCDAPEGTWRYEVSYEGDVVFHNFNVGSCPYNLVVNQTVHSGEITGYRASNNITAINLIENNTCVTMAAGNQVRLINQFHAQQGSEVHIFIRDCDESFSTPSIDVTYKKLMDEKEMVIAELEFRADTIANKSLKAYPNPFFNNLHLSYHIPEDEMISLYLFDMTGRMVKTLINEKEHLTGTYQLSINTSDWRTGTYIMVMISKNRKESIKLTRIR